LYSHYIKANIEKGITKGMEQAKQEIVLNMVSENFVLFPLYSGHNILSLKHFVSFVKRVNGKMDRN
jgi:hypothetical protein